MKIKRTKKTKILMVCIVVLATLIVWAAYLLSQNANADARFIRDLDRGLTASWAQKNDEFTLQKKQGKLSTEFIDLEYSAVSNFKEEKFKDKKLGELANTYISSLEACRKAAKVADPNKDFDKFWTEFSGPYGTRIGALYDIYNGNYELELSDPSYTKKKNMFLVQGWILHKVDSISFSREAAEDGTVALKAKVSNDSGFDLKYVNLELELYNKKGKSKGRVTVFAENIKKGSEFELTGYLMSDSNIEGYKIISETCEIDQ